ncbi:MAG: DinB family protein [Candidatus Tectimicrobiota bacterium]
MEAQQLICDALERIRSILQRTLPGLTLDELHRQPSPETNSIAWLTWHLTRVQDNGLSGLFNQPQAWVSEGWHARFGMDPDPDNEGQGNTPAQVAAFRVESGQLLLDYHARVCTRSKGFMAGLRPADFDRELPEPQYQPLPTVGVRCVSILSDNLQHAGQVAYLRGLWHGFGWR